MADKAVQTLCSAIYETTKLAEQQQNILVMLKRVHEEALKVHRNCSIAKTVGAFTAAVGVPLGVITAGAGFLIVGIVVAGSGIATTAGSTITELIITKKMVKKLRQHWEISTQLRTRLPELLEEVVRCCHLDTTDKATLIEHSTHVGENKTAVSLEDPFFSPSRYGSIAVTTASIGATVAGALVASTVLAVVDIGNAINGWADKSLEVQDIEKAIEDQQKNIAAVTEVQMQLGDLLIMEKSALNWGFNDYCYNIAFIGRQGVGKSSLINALRLMAANNQQAAKVGITRTTTEPKAYHYIADGEPISICQRPAVLWDIPAAGTKETGWESYWTTYMLPKFDLLVMVSNSSFIAEEIALARAAQLCNKKVIFVRTKIDSDVENLLTDFGLSSYNEQVDAYLNKSKEALFVELSKGGVSTRCGNQSKLFLVSSRAIIGSVAKHADENEFLQVLRNGGTFVFEKSEFSREQSTVEANDVDDNSSENTSGSQEDLASDDAPLFKNPAGCLEFS